MSTAAFMIPPDKNHLKALAGWAISARGNSSDKQHIALCKFQDGCSDLAEVADDLVPVKAREPAKQVKRSVPATMESMPIEVQEHLGVKQGGECRHSFDIRTQLCKYCSISYRKAHGRKPELM